MLNKIIPFRERIQMWVTYAAPGNIELGNEVENENFPYVSFLWVHCCCEKWIGFKLSPNSTLLTSVREGSQTVSGAIWDGDRVGEKPCGSLLGNSRHVWLQLPEVASQDADSPSSFLLSLNTSSKSPMRKHEEMPRRLREPQGQLRIHPIVGLDACSPVSSSRHEPLFGKDCLSHHCHPSTHKGPDTA